MGKKRKCPEFENHERWLVSYADMVTLLFAVFVVLYSLNTAGDKKDDKAAGSMQESFNTPLEDIPIDRRVGPSSSGFGVFENMRGNSPDKASIFRLPTSKRMQEILEQEADLIRVELEERLYGPKKFRAKMKPGVERVISVHQTTKGVTIRLLARHFYDHGSIKMKRETLKNFDKVIEIVKELGRKVTIEGHTDSIPPTGRYSNWEISALRATDAVRYMIRRHNFPATKLAAAGYADQKPIAHNGTKEGRKLNRRIEIQIHYDEEEFLRQN